MAGEIKVSILLAAAIVSIVAVYHVLSARFPDDYGDITALAAERYGVDEPLVRAVILVESGYREDAVSGAGAEGLMQLMPATRAEVSAKSGVPDDGSPRSEILMGTYYLRSMLDLTGNVRFISLDEAQDRWAQVLLEEASQPRTDTSQDVVEHGYDIHHCQEKDAQLLRVLK